MQCKIEQDEQKDISATYSKGILASIFLFLIICLAIVRSDERNWTNPEWSLRYILSFVGLKVPKTPRQFIQSIKFEPVAVEVLLNIRKKIKKKRVFDMMYYNEIKDIYNNENLYADLLSVVDEKISKEK